MEYEASNLKKVINLFNDYRSLSQNTRMNYLLMSRKVLMSIPKLQTAAPNITKLK